MLKLPDNPRVSVIVACYNAADFLADAIRSALAQSLAAIEVIVVDDGSSDASVDIAERLAREDGRVRVARLPRNGGPATARNRGIEMARGTWLAVLDSDDFYHPDRLRTLIDAADASGADMIADDLLLFDEADASPPRTFLSADRGREPSWVELKAYLAETVLYGRSPNLGFLKPLIRADFLHRNGLRYNEELRIAEDDDLILRALAAGGRYRIAPAPTYFYRKHGGSISHRLSLTNIDRMLAAADAQALLLADAPPATVRAFQSRRRALLATRHFTLAVEALRTRQPVRALMLALRHPRLVPLFRMPLAARLGRLFASRKQAPATERAVPHVCIISRQRLVGATNGSSAYLLDLAVSVRAAGMEPHLVQPSPAIFGRLPVLRLKPEMDVFASHRLRGAVRIGRCFLALNPRAYLSAGRAVAARTARRIGLCGGWTIDRPAPYAVAAPWTKADLLYVTRHARPHADRVIADYAFQAAAFPYVARPDSPTAIVMHDLFHARADQFEASGDGDSVAPIDRDAECALLGRADVVLAIQKEEAAFVRDAVPEALALTVPVAARPAATIQPGEAARLLFVGSNTAPNITGLNWFFEKVWPAVRDRRPAMELDIAGTVAWAFPSGGPPGVRFLGLIDDLAAAYAQAGIVISPLIHGSGLKIKLVEALAQGKAVVATSITLQGVEELVGDAVRRSDDPAAFAEAIVALADDDATRASLCAAALEAARQHFSAETCHATFRRWLETGLAAG